MVAEVSAAKAIGEADRVLRDEAVGLRKIGHEVRLGVRAPREGAARMSRSRREGVQVS